MACRQDVKSAILNKVMDELVEGRYTFQRLSDDTIMVNGRVDDNRSKAKSNTQASAIARTLVNAVEKSFQGQVKGDISQHSKYDPYTVRFRVNPAYIDAVYNTIPANQRTDASETYNQERDYVNTNTGPNTYHQLEMFSPETETILGSFNTYIKFKEGQLNSYRERLNQVQTDKKKKDITVEQLTALNKKEKELKLLIDGNDELGITGLKGEIAKLKKNGDVNAVGYYAEKDLARIKELVSTTDVDNLREAQALIDFYTLAGTFRPNVENPFFTEEEIFLEDQDGKLTTELRLPKATVDQFKEWATRAQESQVILDAQNKEVLVNTVNQDSSVVKTYGGQQFTYDQLTNKEDGLKDTDWVSMWTMDITQGIWSNNGTIPQVMFSYLVNSFEKKLAWARSVEERINKMTPGVQKELVKLKHSLRAKGIKGVKGASYQLFKEITKEGNETGGLVQRFVKEFFDGQSKALNDFSRAFDSAKTEDDYNTKTRKINKAFEDLKKWRRENTIIMDITRLPEFSETTDTAHKQELVAILGEKGYKEQVERQKKLLTKYEADRQSTIDTAMALEGVDAYDQLSVKAKSDISYWENNNSPFRGIEDYQSVRGIFFGDRKSNNYMSYNNFVPRKYKADIAIDKEGLNYTFADSQKETGFYSEAYATIEGNTVLSEFYDVIKEVTENVRENMPYELQQKMAVNSIPALQKTSAEIMLDKNRGILSSIIPAYRRLMEKIRLSFGVTKQSEVSYATMDAVTGRPNYTVNDTFFRNNGKAIDQRMKIEQFKFLQALNAGRDEGNKVNAIKRFSSFPLDSLNEQSLILLAQYLHLDVPLADIKARRLDAIRAVTGDNVQIGKYIRDYSLHTIVQTQSFDLAKIAKYFSNLTMEYAARKEALPILEILKKHYEGIKAPKTNNLGNNIFNVLSGKNMMDGVRVNANKQMEDWFQRVALGNYDTKHVAPHGMETNINKLVKDKKIKAPKIYKNIYSNEEKQKIKEINDLLANEKDEKKIEELAKMRDSLGKVRTATAAFDNLLGWIRTLRLGYNLSSATTNFMEGVTSNMIIASLGEYFDPKEIYYGYSVMKWSFLKNTSFGKIEVGVAKRNRSLMDKFNVIMDSKNELQKSSVKTYADRVEWLNPHALNQRVEYINQSPIMIAMLRSTKIKDKNGNEASLWEAYDNNGHLKDEFKTEENIKNWDELVGDDYLNFKQKLHKAIVLAHGNYDDLRGMMIKSSSMGKAMMMFKGWLPMQMYWRFAAEQDDIQSGVKGFKGRYRSYGAGGAGVHGLVIGAAMFGWTGIPVGLGLGLVAGGLFGADTGVGVLKQSVEVTKLLARKMIGMPINLLAGRQLIDAGDKGFEKWVGKGNFTSQDAKNMRGNIADIAMQLAWLAMILMVKGLFWDDDDNPNDPERIAHNILVNKLMQLSSQASMYINPKALYKNTLADNAVYLYLTEVAKEIDKVENYFAGKDIAASGSNAGQSQLWNQTKKIILPGMFKDGNPATDIIHGKMPSLGFESQSKKVFEESPWHKEFKSAATLDAEHNKSDRAERKSELEEVFDLNEFEGETEEDKQKAKEKQIRKMLNEEFPTPTRLKKLEMTREEYDEARKNAQE